MKKKVSKLKRIAKRICNDKKGFTLIEVLLSIGIFMVISAMTFTAIMGAVRFTGMTANRTRASAISTQAISEAEGEDISDSFIYGNTLFLDGEGGGKIYEVRGSYNGEVVVYYYYRPYHPFGCADTCPYCNKKDVIDE